MKTIVTVSVRVEKEDARGQRRRVWERAVEHENDFPTHTVTTALFTIAHSFIHPPRPQKPLFKD